mgnify:CR=1 FL=1
MRTHGLAEKKSCERVRLPKRFLLVRSAALNVAIVLMCTSRLLQRAEAHMRRHTAASASGARAVHCKKARLEAKA